MCTGVRLSAENGAVVYGRTLEFGRDIKSQIIIIPRNYSFTGTAPSGKSEGLHWKSRYAVVGANALGVIGLIDGVNEKGLAGGLFYFPGYAEYQEVAQGEGQQSLACWELLTWILTSFESVAQVRTALPTIKVSKALLPQWAGDMPVHAIVHDVTGASLVIEYVKGELRMHDNPLGIITNAPDFTWHLANLKNYVHISPYNVKSSSLGPLELTPFGHGSGMLGLPGDFTPPARFVRAAFLSQLAVAPKTQDDARKLLFHVLDFFNIPEGVLREKSAQGDIYDYTQWTTGADLTNKKYYWHTYHNRNMQMVDLNECDLDAQKPIIIQMEQKEVIQSLIT